MADNCRYSEMAAKKIKLQEEAISEILVADTDSEQGAEASDVEGDFEDEEEQQQKQQQASTGVKPQTATSGGKEYEQWKLRTVFDTLNEAYAKFYNPPENLAVDEVIVKFMGRVIFRQYIPKKRKCFGIKVYKLCDESGCIYIYIYMT